MLSAEHALLVRRSGMCGLAQFLTVALAVYRMQLTPHCNIPPHVLLLSTSVGMQLASLTWSRCSSGCSSSMRSASRA